MTNANWRTFLLAAIAGMALAACGGEDAASPAGTPTAAPPAGAPSQTPPNATPVITGTPASTVVAGTTYTFQPSATDADAGSLSFSATGLPSWAAINTTTGVVYG